MVSPSRFERDSRGLQPPALPLCYGEGWWGVQGLNLRPPASSLRDVRGRDLNHSTNSPIFFHVSNVLQRGFLELGF